MRRQFVRVLLFVTVLATASPLFAAPPKREGDPFDFVTRIVRTLKKIVSPIRSLIDADFPKP
jgi:hypothetical protein